MGNGTHRTDVFTDQARNFAGPVNGYGIEWADKSGFVWAYCYAGTTVDTGVPTDFK
jgi:hypothetical protein